MDAHVKHEEGDPITQLLFLINEGALVSATEDTLHLWNFRQKIPQVVQSLKFQRERYNQQSMRIINQDLFNFRHLMSNKRQR